MTRKVGIRDLARNSNILDAYDYIEVVDKKTHKFKGLFISPEYADEFRDFLDKKISQRQQDKLKRIMKYAGKGEIYERFDHLNSSQIKEKKAMEQNGKK